MSSSDFYEKVYEVVRQVPYGRVTSYGAIARYLGAARSSRMVGYAMNMSHTKDVPAHRGGKSNGNAHRKAPFSGYQFDAAAS